MEKYPTFQKLIKVTPLEMDAVIEAKGDPTKYSIK